MVLAVSFISTVKAPSRPSWRSKAQNTGSLSSRGKHDHRIVPCGSTSAAMAQLPITPSSRFRSAIAPAIEIVSGAILGRTAKPSGHPMVINAVDQPLVPLSEPVSMVGSVPGSGYTQGLQHGVRSRGACQVDRRTMVTVCGVNARRPAVPPSASSIPGGAKPRIRSGKYRPLKPQTIRSILAVSGKLPDTGAQVNSETLFKSHVQVTREAKIGSVQRGNDWKPESALN